MMLAYRAVKIRHNKVEMRAGLLKKVIIGFSALA